MIPVTWHGLIHISYSACHHVILNSSMIMGILPNGELRSHKTYHLDPGLCNPTWRNWFTLATSKHQISSCIPTQICPLLFSNWVTPQMSGFRMYSSNLDPISIISSYWLLLISDKFLPKPMSTSPFDPFQHSHGKIVIPSSIPHFFRWEQQPQDYIPLDLAPQEVQLDWAPSDWAPANDWWSPGCKKLPRPQALSRIPSR